MHRYAVSELPSFTTRSVTPQQRANAQLPGHFPHVQESPVQDRETFVQQWSFRHCLTHKSPAGYKFELVVTAQFACI